MFGPWNRFVRTRLQGLLTMTHDFAIFPAGPVDSASDAVKLVRAMRASRTGEAPSAIRHSLDELTKTGPSSFSIECVDSRGAIIATKYPEEGLLREILLISMERGLAVYDLYLDRLFDPRGRVDVEVCLAGKVTLPYLTPALLHDLVLWPTWPSSEDLFFIIERNAEEYVQTLRDEDDAYQLEYRDGSRDAHFEFYTHDSKLVTDVMWAWTIQNPGWRTAVPWSPLTFEDGD